MAGYQLKQSIPVKEDSQHASTRLLNVDKSILLLNLTYYLQQWGLNRTDVAMIKIID